MKKKILLTIMLISSLYSQQATADDENSIAAKSWRNGFITAYKAMEVETKLQGIDNKPIHTKKYVIYFDANKDNISDWDSLMVQMFGYSSSIYKPIRAKNKWLIFGSYDNKATAYQELRMLNNKIFKNSEKYKLQIFVNKNNKVFLADNAILTNEIKGLKEILLKRNAKILSEKEKKIKAELEKNQKIAIVYLDKEGNQIKNATVKQLVKKTKYPHKDKKGKIYRVRRLNSKLYLKPVEDDKYFLKTMKLGDRLRIIDIKDGWGLTSKNHYIKMKSFWKLSSNNTKTTVKAEKPVETTPVTKKPVIKRAIEPMPEKKKTTVKAEKPVEPVVETQSKKKILTPEEPLNGYIDTNLMSLDLYKIKNEPFIYNKKIYKKFIKSGIYKNNFVDTLAYSYKVEDENGDVFYKIYKKDFFIKKSDEIFFHEKR